MRNYALILLLGMFSGCLCTAPDASVRTLEKAGFKNIEITGYTPISCANNDLSSTGFTAKDSNGVLVQGVVCCSIREFCHIRFDSRRIP